MPILPALIIVEIVSVFLISSTNPYSISKLRKNVLKVFPQVFAEYATPSAETSTPNPDTSTVTPSDTTPSTPAPDNSQPTQPSDTSSPNPTENPQQSSYDNSAINQPQQTPSETNNSQPNNATSSSSESLVNPSPASQQNNATGSSFESPAIPSPASAVESQNQPVVLDESQQQAQAASQVVITGSDMISGPVENIDKNVEQQSTVQDQKLEQAKTPEEKTSLSVDFAKESVKAAEQSLRNDDLQTTTYVVQRISDQIDTAVSSTQISKSSKPLEQLFGFCKQVDFVFRTQQLSVPDEETQDFEIVRGKCLNITQ